MIVDAIKTCWPGTLFQFLRKFFSVCCCCASAPHAFPSSSSRLLTPMQGPGCCVLSKTRPTVQETAGIPIWSPSDSCSACAASAQRCLFELSSKHLRVHCANVFRMKSVCNVFSFSERPREMQHHQVSSFVLWKPSSRASAVLSKMHRSDVHAKTLSS